MFTLAVVFLSLLISTIRVNAQACDAKNPCPASAPCCSEYGFCGNDAAHCLAGCNPLFSNTVTSCKASPVCKSQTYQFADASRILTDRSKYDGSPDTYDWVVDGGNVEVSDNNLVMILTETNAGTRVSSTRFVHYGTMTATLKTGRWDGVVVGFITMSNVRDEIDWEFPGNRVTQGQTNFFWQGTNGQGDTTSGLTDTYENYHDYTIDWSPDALVFKIDGKIVRNVKASDFGNKFPTTPSRIQLSIWPAGTNASAPGTIQWAGGMIKWDDPDFIAAGNQFRTYFKSIDVKCADPQAPSGDQISYVYAEGSTSAKQTINFSSDSPVMGDSTGTNPPASNSTSSTTTTGTSSSSATETSSVTGSSSTLTGTNTLVTDTASSSTSSLTGSPTGAPSASSGNSGNGKNGNGRKNSWRNHGHNSHSQLFQAGQTDATAPPAQTAAHNETGNGGFFGGADTGGSASVSPTASSASNSATSSTPTNSGSSAQSTPTTGSGNNSAAHAIQVGVLPIFTAVVAMSMALAL